MIEGNMIIKNASEIVTAIGKAAKFGNQMKDLKRIENGAVVIEEGAKIMSGFCALMFVRIALKSVWLVWNCSSLTTVPPSFVKEVLKKEPSPEE